ncbi:MAG: lysophospholipase L1-like esterase [Rhodothermales bacterium]|jgi:lysophospholipase L1-like esterase
MSDSVNRTIFLALALLMTTTETFAQDWANLERYRSANQALETPAAPGRVVFMGDSITEGWDLPASFAERPYVNRGISGQTTPQMLVRFRQDVIDLEPDIVVILAGTNDIAGNTGPASLVEIAGNIASMIELALMNGITPIIASVLPAADYPWSPGLMPDIKIPALNAMLKAYAEVRGVRYLDYFSAMEDGENGLQAALTSDGVHLTAAGYEAMTRQAKRALVTALK